MRHFLLTSFTVLALVMGAAGAAPTAHAQSETCPIQNGIQGIIDTSDQLCHFFDSSGKEVGTPVAPTVTENTLTPPIDKAAAATPSSLPPNPNNSEGFGVIMTWIMSLFAWLVGAAAITLNYAVYYTVVTMGDYVNNLSAVGVTWRILRDVGNIMLIFGFLAVGITTILNVDWYGGGKKMLPMLLVAAVFLNFSLFITEAVIDTGNLFATQFYTQINGGKLPTPDDMSKMSIESEGISNKIMGQLGLQTIYTEGRTNTGVFKAGNTWIIAFMSIILFLITAFVMFSLAFILIARFVILLFLIILAPVGFAGLAVPRLKNTANKWWGALFEQTVTAPVLLLMLYIALAVITDAKFLTGVCSPSAGSTNTTCTSNWLGYVSGNFAGFASMMLSFFVAMGLLLAVIVFAKKLSAFGAGAATQFAGKLTFGATAWAGRNTVGWGANRFGKYLRSTRVGRVPIIGTGLVKGLDRVATGSFDVRGTKALKNFPGGGIEAGAAQKGGYRADLKGRIESRTKYAEELKGRELTKNEKAELAPMQNELSKLEKRRASVKTPEQAKALEEQITTQEKKIAEKEEPTDKGSKRKYASNLELGYLGLDDKSFFNKYINLASNTEAAKKIRDEAKKSKDDKELDNFRKALKRQGGEESEGKPKDESKSESKPEGEAKPEAPKS